MSEPQSSTPWPVWAAVTIIVALVSSPYLYEYLKGSKPVSPQASVVPHTDSDVPQLTYGTWTLHDALDDRGHNWSNSTLTITSQKSSPNGLLFDGYIEWRLDNVLLGTEFVSGNYLAAKREVFLKGYRVTDQRIVEGAYSALLSDDGRSLTGGTWGSTGGRDAGVPGRWWANR